MRTAKLGGLEVSRIGLGAMGMSHGYTGAGTDDAAPAGSLDGYAVAQPSAVLTRTR
jgi:aryl-alcohol dehydrogenase-like predicted oxidoreductase